MTSAAATVALRVPRSLRIIALPLTRAPHHFTYYHFVNPPAEGGKNADSLTNRAVAKALDVWAGFGKADEGSWKRRAFLYGERIADRLDFEELALRSLDPSLGPKLSSIIPRTRTKPHDTPTTKLLYPPSALDSPIEHLHTLLSSRGPRHRKGLYTWLAVTPLTFPLKLIPIIPNFPFFFCAWRAWSHYRAYSASSYLDALLKRGAIQPAPSPQLDAIYAKYAPAASRSEAHARPDSQAHSNSDTDTDTGGLLLTRNAVPELQQALQAELGDFEESTSFAAGMYRALEQARVRVEKSGKPS
ncbi:hypothetical protein L226DRAFT_615005 [Lentinus tigrinus ALCF2SS1-7]|uniref:Mitochondrial K+-H+ exchange-related-domain-containing protein n=1 Tax=Lentinus tigrinus ALCF2SS1-6 TaxID=1328759 RepID=A0A5C2S3E2_9APHY|nr:hypothetical protein L227DRAFT_602112 [Lentinus tigrinus ALCF2SS1-6]RPD72303.1 hypothetical protein L226DRAFT_615005 [Lentinus tigrinus ALCF2SS1-7]